jgi:hypothetical protein
MTLDHLIIDPDYRPLSAHLPVRAVHLRNCSVDVHQQRHRQVVLVDESLARSHILRRNPDDRGIMRRELVRPIPVQTGVFMLDLTSVASGRYTLMALPVR